jgi:DNA-3-methyladenine glycosylase II
MLHRPARKAILHLKKADPVMAAIVGRVGPYRIEYREPGFETLVRSIVFQQLNGKAARTIFDRVAAAAGGAITPQALVAVPEAALRAAGLSQQKLSYVRDLAERTASGEVDFSALSALPDDDVIASLTHVKGVGVWTVQMFLIFALKRADVLPTADLGVRAAIQRAYGLAGLPKPAEMERIAEPWRPYRSVASWYLWRSLEGPVLI